MTRSTKRDQGKGCYRRPESPEETRKFETGLSKVEIRCDKCGNMRVYGESCECEKVESPAGGATALSPIESRGKKLAVKGQL